MSLIESAVSKQLNSFYELILIVSIMLAINSLRFYLPEVKRRSLFSLLWAHTIKQSERITQEDTQSGWICTNMTHNY